MFGGTHKIGPSHYLAGTWVWDGSNWTQQSPATSPPARFGAAMAYDTATGNVVMFSGYSSSLLLSDTWVWDGSNWTEQSPATSPAARWGAPMVYDAATGKVVMFGGFDIATGTNDFADTWVWDGSTWTKQAPATSPSARYEASMAYDAATGNVVLFGGLNGAGVSPLNDTWTWGSG